jgi:hypothetical protein
MPRILYLSCMLLLFIAGCRKDGEGEGDRCFKYEETPAGYVNTRDTGRVNEMIPIAVMYGHYDGCAERGYLEFTSKGSNTSVRAFKKVIGCSICTMAPIGIRDTFLFSARVPGVYQLTMDNGGYGHVRDTVVVW